MPKPNVSVIIPCYNRAHCVREAIDSVLAQSAQACEIIVVDDGSTDSTHEVLGTYGKVLKVIQQKNSGASVARNTGVRAAKGEWVAFLDSDDTWEPDKLKVQLEDLHSNPSAVAHMVDSMICSKSGGHCLSLFRLRGLKGEYSGKPFRKRPLNDVMGAQFFTSSWMLKRKVFEKAGYFNPALKIFEDIDLLARFALEGPFVVSCYQGTRMWRRKDDSTNALSDLYRNERLKSLENLISTYRNLKKDSRLSSDEYKMVCRALGGALCETFEEHKKKYQWKDCMTALFYSIIEEPGFHSAFRAFLAVTGLRPIMEHFLSSGGKRDGFRRSETDTASLNKG